MEDKVPPAMRNKKSPATKNGDTVDKKSLVTRDKRLLAITKAKLPAIIDKEALAIANKKVPILIEEVAYVKTIFFCCYFCIFSSFYFACLAFKSFRYDRFSCWLLFEITTMVFIFIIHLFSLVMLSESSIKQRGPSFM